MNYRELEQQEQQETSADIRGRVAIARRLQMERYKDQNIWFNSQLSPRSIKKYCRLEPKEESLLEQAFIKMNLTARAYHRILKVARTIADLDMSEQIRTKHISEAICYRSMDQKYWGE